MNDFLRRIGVSPAAAVGGVIALVLLILVASRAGRGPAPKPQPGPERAGRLQQEPTITLFVNQTGETKRIKLDDYVAGVVGGEIKNDWPRQALEAQAILARTFTLQKMSQGKTKHGTDASTDPEEFQAYAPQNINGAVRAAVRATRGEVITYRGKPVRAWFHSCAGGITATASEGLAFTKEPTPYIKVVRDPPCPDPSKQRWTASFTGEEVRAAFGDMGLSFSGLNPARVAARGPSGRATRLSIGGVEVGAAALRTALGPERMRSTLLESLRVEGDRLVMRGRGWGHGVGMSQFGALDKARRGWDAERIVMHYFRDVKIEQRWD